MTQTRPALFLDRDGVMVEDVEYLHRVEDTRFMPGLFELTAAYSAAGYRVVMATNQSGIGRGLYDEAVFTRLCDWMRANMKGQGGCLDAIYYAPTHPTEAKGHFRRVSDWRKPGPGMYFQAARDLTLDLSRSVSIGNELRDVDGSRAAGIPRLFQLAPEARGVERRDYYTIVPRLMDVAAVL